MSPTTTSVTDLSRGTGTWGYRDTVRYNPTPCAERAIARLETYIGWMARRLAEGDATVADDLAQIGRIALWDIDPSRFHESESRYLRGAIRKTMLFAKRRSR